MTLELTVQNNCQAHDIPSESSLLEWIHAATTELQENAELCIRIVDSNEIQELNKLYRHKDKPTNVLSFPFDMEDLELDQLILGDLVICADIIRQEAQQQHKTLTAHWAHMVIHGTLHLLGYDHQLDADAEVMEQLEINILQKLGYNNPYEEQNQ